MDITHLAVIYFVCYGGAASAEHAAVKIAVVHAQHHTTHILVVVLAFPLAGISSLLDEWLQNESAVLARLEAILPRFFVGHYAGI